MNRILSALAVVLALIAPAAAASVSKTFTTHSEASLVLYISPGESFDYAITGPFVGEVRIERSDNGVNYEGVGLVFSTAASGNHVNTTRKGQGYRVYVSTHSSGSIVATLTDASDIVKEFKNVRGETILRLRDNSVEIPGSLSVAGAITPAANTPLVLTGASGSITSASSVTASAFFGNGAGLTGVTGTDSSKVAKTGDTMTGLLAISGSSLTVSGTVSIGTGTARANHKLTVLNDGSIGESMSRIGLISYGGAAGNNTNFPRINGLYANGSPAVPTVAVNGDVLVNLSGIGWNGVDFSTANAQIRSVAAGTFTTGSTPGRLQFITVPAGTTTQTERMRITDGGNVGIGTTAPAVALDVNGGIVSNSSGTFNSLFVGTFTVSGAAPPNDQALCLTGGRLGYCTTVVGVTGGCTCAAP